jgi:ABC-type Co2+ transport system permease subunit
MNTVAKSVIVALSLGIAGGLIFGFGMVAGPLTPSEGHPTLVAWAVFLIGPLLLCLIGTVIARSWVVRIALIAESTAILMLTVKLLRIFGIVP